MKKFNKKTLIITLLVFFGIVALTYSTFAQQNMGPKSIFPPTNLIVNVEDENDVNLLWTAPPTGNSTYLHWDNGVNYTSFGNFVQPAVQDYVTKWEPNHITDYDGWTITKMRFYVTDPTPTINIIIMTGPDATEIYSQNVPNFNINSWTEITLDTPITIDASTQLWAGLNIDMPIAGAVMGGDEGPAVSGYGDLYRFNNVWYNGGLNWNIQFEVQDLNGKTVNDLLGYNIFRNNIQLNENTWGGISFVDENLLNGTYDYYVTAVYDEGESDPSNTVEVLIAQPVIAYADSMALVDLYNSCNGPNWAINNLWLEGPVNEWFGVITTGTRVTSLWRQSNNLTGDIPASIGDLTALEELHLESNQITSIPESIGNLTALTKLWLGWTQITEIPGTIENLVNLKELHLGQMINPLGTLPDEICNLENLEWLALGSSGLNSLPENFGNLTSVKSLFLQYNNLTELPESFGGMENLDYLALDNNQLTTLPESFGNLGNLSQFYIEENQLTHLPESFGDLESLEIFWARFNQINSLPESFGDLDVLNFLRLGSNNLTELPESFSDMAAIKILFLNNNQITALPEDFGNLETLDIVELGANNISEIPESIGNLSQMSLFAIMDNNLTSLPETMGDIAPDSLFIHNNHIHEIPESMFENTYDLFVALNNDLQFGSIEPFMDNNITNFWYSPQAKIGTETVIEVVNGETISYTLEVSGDNNIYQWYKDNVILADQTSNTLYIENTTISDQGAYQLKVTNPTVPDLELESYDILYSIITGMVEVEDQGFSIYPNPVSGNMLYISLHNLAQAESFAIINGAGQTVKTEQLSNNNSEIDITGLTSGVYIVKIQFSNNSYQIKKLIVK